MTAQLLDDGSYENVTASAAEDMVPLIENANMLDSPADPNRLLQHCDAAMTAQLFDDGTYENVTTTASGDTVLLIYRPRVLYDVQHLVDEAKERAKQANSVPRALREHLAFLMDTPVMLVFPGNKQVLTLRTLMDSGANVASLAVKYMEYYDGPKQQGSPVYGAAGQSRTNCAIAAGNITGILNPRIDPRSDDVSVAFSPHFAVFAQANTFDIIIPYYVMQEMQGIMSFGGAGFAPTYSYTSHAGHVTKILLEHGGLNNRDSTHYDVEDTANRQHSNEAGKGQTIPAHTSQHLSATDLASVQLRGMERSNSTEGDGPARGYRQHLFEICELRSSWILMFAVGGICDLTTPWEHDDASWPTAAMRVTWARDEYPPESREQWIKAMRGTYSGGSFEPGTQYTVTGTAHNDLHQHYGTQSAHHAVGWPREGWPREQTIQHEPPTQNTGAFDTDSRPGRITSTQVTVRLHPSWHTGLDAKSFMAQKHKFEFRNHTLPSKPRAQELPKTPGDRMLAKLASNNRRYRATRKYLETQAGATAGHGLPEAHRDLTCQERNELHVEDISQPRIQDVGCDINTFAANWPDLFIKVLAQTGNTGTFCSAGTTYARLQEIHTPEPPWAAAG
jgi:hypothetical protein